MSSILFLFDFFFNVSYFELDDNIFGVENFEDSEKNQNLILNIIKKPQ